MKSLMKKLGNLGKTLALTSLLLGSPDSIQAQENSNNNLEGVFFEQIFNEPEKEKLEIILDDIKKEKDFTPRVTSWEDAESIGLLEEEMDAEMDL